MWCLAALQVIVVSLMVGSLFFRLGHRVQDARSFHGAAFMAVLFMAMGSMPQIGVVMAQKAVWLKHRDSLLYPGYAHGVVSAGVHERVQQQAGRDLLWRPHTYSAGSTCHAG